LPNTVLGTAYGILGIPSGGIGFEYGQLQFKGNLLQWLLSGGGNGAITLALPSQPNGVTIRNQSAFCSV